mgnify:CR=1 FL=1
MHLFIPMTTRKWGFCKWWYWGIICIDTHWKTNKALDDTLEWLIINSRHFYQVFWTILVSCFSCLSFFQSPKGDISYLQKFFLTYIGGRSPIHLREDFCGTALIWSLYLLKAYKLSLVYTIFFRIYWKDLCFSCFLYWVSPSSEWLKGGIQRVATGLDLDEEALTWGLCNNFHKLGGDSCSRVRLWSGNVLKPLSSAKLITSTSIGKKPKLTYILRYVTLELI